MYVTINTQHGLSWHYGNKYILLQLRQSFSIRLSNTKPVTGIFHGLAVTVGEMTSPLATVICGYEVCFFSATKVSITVQILCWFMLFGVDFFNNMYIMQT